MPLNQIFFIGRLTLTAPRELMIWRAAIVVIVTKVTPTIQAVNFPTSSGNKVVALQPLSVLPTGRTTWATTSRLRMTS